MSIIIDACVSISKQITAPQHGCMPIMCSVCMPGLIPDAVRWDMLSIRMTIEQVRYRRLDK